jgi:hypothetical protein
MAKDDRKDPNSPDDDTRHRDREEKRETGLEYGANEAEQTREREHAGHDRTDEAGEIP